MKKHLSFFFFFLFFLNSISVAFASVKPEEKSLVAVVPDITLIYQMVIFLALIFILNILLYKPILSIIDRRKKNLKSRKTKLSSLMNRWKKELQSIRKN